MTKEKDAQHKAGHDRFFAALRMTGMALRMTKRALKRQRRLFNINMLHRLGALDFVLLGEMHVQDAFVNVGLNFIGINVVGEKQRLLEFLVGEFAAEVAAVVLAFLVIGLLFHLDVEISVGIDVDPEVFFVQTRSGKFYVVLLLGFNYIDGRGRICGPFHPAVVEKVIENVRHPAVTCPSNHR